MLLTLNRCCRLARNSRFVGRTGSFQMQPVWMGSVKISRPFSSTPTPEPDSKKRKVEDKDTKGRQPEAEDEELLLSNETKLKELSIKDRLVHEKYQTRVGVWLLVCAGAVFGMILLGGYTRLSKSGLSMTRWKPIEYKYPRDQAQWEDEFEHYKVTLAANDQRHFLSTSWQLTRSIWKDSRGSLWWNMLTASTEAVSEHCSDFR